MPSLEEQFNAAVKDSKTLKTKPDNDTLLEIYSYYKQSTEGDVTGSRPGPFDFKARAKYEAWEARKGLSEEAAMKAYVKLISHLKAQE
jgi:diazepam-binding inhibitor (GABA receptor modulating acyl-CoA-binding protein)